MMRLFAHKDISPGRVIVVEDGEVAADGPLAALQRVAGDEFEIIEIYVNPADVEATRARWFEQNGAMQ